MDPLVSSLILKQLQETCLDNQHCQDCFNKPVTHVSEAFAIFICKDCAQIHQGLDDRITRILSISEHQWTQQQLKKLSKGGNKRLEEYYVMYEFDRSTIHDQKKNNNLVNTVLRYQIQASLYYKEYLEKYASSGIDQRTSWTPKDDELFNQNTLDKESGRQLVNDINDFVIKLEKPDQEVENNSAQEQSSTSYLGSMWSSLSYAASSIGTSSSNFADRTEERLKKMDDYLYGVEDYVVQSVKPGYYKTKDSIVNNTSNLYNNGREASMIVSTKEKTYEVTNKVSQMVSQAKSKVTDKVKDSMTTETSSADLSGDGFEEVKDEFDQCE